MTCHTWPVRTLVNVLSLGLTIGAWSLALPTYGIVDANSMANTNPPTDGAPWDHLGQVSCCGGIYLAAGWVLGARHVGPGNINLSGTSYAWDGTLVTLTNSDGSITDAIMFHLQDLPPLDNLILVSNTPAALSIVDMVGFGFRAGSSETTFSPEATGFYWSTAGGKSWGNNKINLEGVNSVYDGATNNGVGITVDAFATDFDSSAVPGLQTSDECQAANFDSGGGVFYKDQSAWELAGMILAINEPLTDRPFNSAVYTDQTFALDIPSYRDQIVTVIQSTIPSLSIVPSGTNVQISWPDTGVTYTLEATPSLSPETWTPLSPPLSETYGQFSALVPMADDRRFFRLHSIDTATEKGLNGR